MKREWNIVHECDMEDGTPTLWSIKVSDNKFYWIELSYDNTYNVIDSNASTVLMNCKSLTSAKRWTTMNLL